MGFFDIVKIFVVLLLLLGLMYALLFLVKKYLYQSGSSGSGKPKIKVITTQMLMPKKFISVVQVLDKVYVLGVTDHAFTLIDKKELSESDIAFSDENSVGNSFFRKKRNEP